MDLHTAMSYYGDPNSPYYTKRIIDYCETELEFDFYLCNVVKYVLRHKKKHSDTQSRVKDLKKAIEYLEWEIEKIQLKEIVKDGIYQ